MKKESNTGSVCIHFLDFLRRYAVDKGISSQNVLSVANLDAHLLKIPDTRIPAATFLRVWDYVMETCKDKNFGLNMGSSLNHFPFSHIVFSVMLNDRTLLSALKNMIRYHNLMSDIVSPRLVETDATIVFSIRHQNIDPLGNRHFTEFIFAMILTFLRYLAPRKIRPDIIHFSHEKPEDTSGHQLLFNSGLVFRAEQNEMIFPKKILSAPVHLSNLELTPLLELSALSKLKKFNTPGSWSRKVETAIISGLNSGVLTIDSIAETLAVSKRTLQNRLKEEGISFRRIYESVRRKTAVFLLGNHEIPMVDITFLLGFSEQSAFNHAFKKWTGQTPGQYRIHISENPSDAINDATY